jgi:KaiC/GvpD/RAD55 family RecA-like ATPase
MVKDSISRVATGIPGVDRLLQGGLPFGTTTLLSGACRTGKSTFAMQFLYNGARLYNEPGVYITLEEDPEKLVENMGLFGWDIAELIKKKKMLVIKPDVYKFDSIKRIIADAIDKIGAKRLVVDSYSVMLTYFNDPYEIRNGLVQLDREIKKMNCTTLVISDIKDRSDTYSTTGVEEFIVDGVLVLYMIKDKNPASPSRRAIFVRKMRATNHPLLFFPFEIKPNGVTVSDKGMDGRIFKSKANPPKAAPRRKKKEPKKKEKKAKPMPKKPRMIELQALKAKGHHSWKWQHL